MLNRCYECSVKFMNAKLTTSNAIKSTNKIDQIDFPALTICPTYENPYKGKNIKIILKQFILIILRCLIVDVLKKNGFDLSRYRKGFMYPNKTESSGQDVLKIYKEATFDIQ